MYGFYLKDFYIKLFGRSHKDDTRMKIKNEKNRNGQNEELKLTASKVISIMAVVLWEYA